MMIFGRDRALLPHHCLSRVGSPCCSTQEPERRGRLWQGRGCLPAYCPELQFIDNALGLCKGNGKEMGKPRELVSWKVGVSSPRASWGPIYPNLHHLLGTALRAGLKCPHRGLWTDAITSWTGQWWGGCPSRHWGDCWGLQLCKGDLSCHPSVSSNFSLTQLG